jgi:hypothetical protein
MPVCEPRGAPVRPIGSWRCGIAGALRQGRRAARGPGIRADTASCLRVTPNQHLKLTKAPPEDIRSYAVACSVNQRYRKGIGSAAMSCTFSCDGRRRLSSLNAFR